MKPPTSSWISLSQRLGLPETPIKEGLWQLMCRLRVAAPGIIQSYDANNQTVSVKVAIREKIKVNTSDGQGSAAPVAQDVEIPILNAVPICIPRAGGFELTLPIQAGDECLLIFADNCYDAWWSNSGVQNQVDKRRHHLSDAIAILGVWSQPRKVTNYSTTAMQLRNDDGTRVIEVSSTEIKVTAGSTILEVSPSQVTVTGNLVVNGSVSATGATINGRAFMTHTHSGVTVGAGSTGGVV